MSNFKDFLDKAKKYPVNPVSNNSRSLFDIKKTYELSFSSKVTVASLGSKDKESEFKEDVYSTVMDDDSFINKFSEKIGNPMENETEDEFVERGKQILMKMLHHKFKL